MSACFFFCCWINDLTINSTKYNIISVITGLNVSETDVTGLRMVAKAEDDKCWGDEHEWNIDSAVNTHPKQEVCEMLSISDIWSFIRRCIKVSAGFNAHAHTYTHADLCTNWKWVSEANLQHSDLPNHDNHHKRHSQLKKKHPLFGLFSCSLRVKMIFPC